MISDTVHSKVYASPMTASHLDR
ncbi:MAG: hypothetical protein QOK31_279, partial [Solirubrobacteraceae bacterium]|nr:hypothetical protein [Solirubrobacteraceae bacterium]